jgi:hypothetical protein
MTLTRLTQIRPFCRQIVSHGEMSVTPVDNAKFALGF